MNDKLINRGDDLYFDLAPILNAVWSRKLLIAAIATVFAISGAVYSKTLPDEYTSQALLAPTESAQSGLSGMMQQYSGLASLAGFSVPAAGNLSRSKLAQNIITSRSFVEKFASDRNIAPALMAASSWDPVSRQLHYDESKYDPKEGKWVAEEWGARATSGPTPQEVYAAFTQILKVTEDRVSGLVTVTVTFMSPDLAQEWADGIISDINEAMRLKEISEAEASIQYLRDQTKKTALADLDRVFFELIESQMQTVMLASVREEYVFTTVDPAFVPEKRSAPNRVMMVIIFFLSGCVIGVLTSAALFIFKRGD